MDCNRPTRLVTEAAGTWEGTGNGVCGSESNELQQDAVGRGAGGGDAGGGVGPRGPLRLGGLSVAQVGVGALCSGILWVAGDQNSSPTGAK